MREKLEKKLRGLAFELGLDYYEDLSCYTDFGLKEEIREAEKILRQREKGNLYVCVDDLQGGNFCVGCVSDLKGWREKAIEWCFMDDHYGLERDLKNYKIKNCDLIDFIQDYWEIEIVKFDKNIDYEEEYDLELYYMNF